MTGFLLSEHGACLERGAARQLVAPLTELFDLQGKAGRRLTELGAFAAELGQGGVVGSIAAAHLGRAVQPVRVLAFDKSDDNNWALGWHQDRTVCVEERHDVYGFGPWTLKQGLQHVVPPFDLLERMLTLRIHVDPVDETNAPLLVALGSHRLGPVSEDDIRSAVERCPVHSCLADAGDIWVYSTPILHASDRAAPGRRRRVLQVDYSADSLPPPLKWLGISRGRTTPAEPPARSSRF